MKILCFGEVLWDHIEEKYHLGGASLNFAAHSAQFGCESYLISAVGQDKLGENALKEVSRINVRSDYIGHVSQPTGVVEVTMNKGIPSYEIVTGTAWDNIPLPPEQLKSLITTDWDLFYMGSLAQRSQVNIDLLHKKILPQIKAKDLFFDVNLRQNYYSREVIDKSLSHTTILKLNDEELPVISRLLYGASDGDESLPELLFSRLKSTYGKLEILILTKGPEGADILTTQGLKSFPIESHVSVVDTVGAGDSYSGAFCFAWYHTGDLERSARFAQRVADRVVSQAGALPEYGEEILTESRNMSVRKHI